MQEIPARTKLNQVQLKAETQVRDGVSEHALDFKWIALAHVEVLECTEGCAHRAAHQQHGLLTHHFLPCLISFGWYIEIPRFAIIGIHDHKVESKSTIEAKFTSQGTDSRRRVNLRDFAVG